MSNKMKYNSEVPHAIPKKTKYTPCTTTFSRTLRGFGHLYFFSDFNSQIKCNFNSPATPKTIMTTAQFSIPGSSKNALPPKKESTGF